MKHIQNPQSLRQLSIDNGLSWGEVRNAYIKLLDKGNHDCADLKIQAVWDLKKRKVPTEVKQWLEVA